MKGPLLRGQLGPWKRLATALPRTHVKANTLLYMWPTARAQHTSHDTHLCYADGLALVGCLWAPTSPSSSLPLRAGRQRANLFTTSAPGSGDELRLAQCPPSAGPGLSHGGQMTAEAKRVRSCSPQELLEAPPYPRRWAALPKQSGTPRQTGWVDTEVQAPTGPSPDQRTTGQMAPSISAQPGPIL